MSEDCDARWLRPYVPFSVLRAADVLADHVDFWEEEAFRVHGRWRKRELTDFIRAGLTADKRMDDRFRQLLSEYVELSLQCPPKNDDEARQTAVRVAILEARRWFQHRIKTSAPSHTVQTRPPPAAPRRPAPSSRPAGARAAPCSRPGEAAP